MDPEIPTFDLVEKLDQPLFYSTLDDPGFANRILETVSSRCVAVESCSLPGQCGTEEDHFGVEAPLAPKHRVAQKLEKAAGLKDREPI